MWSLSQPASGTAIRNQLFLQTEEKVICLYFGRWILILTPDITSIRFCALIENKNSQLIQCYIFRKFFNIVLTLVLVFCLTLVLVFTKMKLMKYIHAKYNSFTWNNIYAKPIINLYHTFNPLLPELFFNL